MTLIQSLNGFYRFMIAQTVKGRRSPQVSLSTARGRIQRVRGMLGWQHHKRQPRLPLEQLHLQNLLPSCGLTVDGKVDEAGLTKSIEEVEAILQFLREERKVGPVEELWYLETLMHLADYLYHDSISTIIDLSYQDLPIRIKLRNLCKETRRRRAETPESADITKKWIPWEDFLQVVVTLKTECDPIGINNCRRSDKGIAASHQRYLLFAFFSAFPDRQRTPRELVYGDTLVKERGLWIVRHKRDDFKTGKSFCKKSKVREVILPAWLYPALEAWIFGCEDEAGNWQGVITEAGRTGWRQAFSPKHECVFTQQNGKPFSHSTLYDLFRRTALRLTSQACHPHLVRNMIITHVLEQGVSDEVLQALATLLAHSLKTLMEIYDRRPLQKKSQPAVDLLETLAREAGLGLAA